MTEQRIVTEQPVVMEQPVVTAQPVVSQPTATVTQRPVIVQSDVVQTEQVVRRTRGAFSASQVVHALCGVFLVVFGAVAAGRAGFGGSVGEQETEVLGIAVTTLIGLVAVGAGVLLLLAALSPAGRGVGGVVGVALLVGGIVIAAGSEELLSDLHTESSLGWVGIIVGAAALIGAFLPTHIVSRNTQVSVR